MNENGSATFAGDVGIGGTLPSDPAIALKPDGVNGANMFLATSPGSGGLGDGTKAVVLKANGDSTDSTYTGGHIKVITYQTAGSTSVKNAFEVKNIIDANPEQSTVLIKANGSAEFSGTVSTTDFFKSQRSDGSYYVFQAIGPAGESIRMNADGSSVFSGTVTATVVPPSDARFKENITPAKPQLADVVALGGLLKNYDWTDEAPLNEELRSVRQLGLVAQEVAEVCPSLVKDINRTKTMEITPAVVGPKGRVITEAVTSEVDDSYKGLSQEALIMKLIGAVAELSAEVQALKDAA